MGLQSRAGSPMKGFLIILGLLGVSISKDPGVFKEYFDDSLRSVDVSQEVVLNSCLNDNGAASTKVNDAYGKCFGADYDFEELANNAGDNDGLPKSLAENEACFYKEMGWVSGNDVDSSAIKGDLAGLQGTALDTFTGKVDECTAWDGNFGGAGRVRRAAQELPSLVQGASAEGGWIRALVRKAREADKGDGQKGKNAKKKGNKKRGKQAKKGRSGKKKGNRKKGNKQASRKKGRSGKKGKRKNGNKSVKGRNKKGNKAGRSGRKNKKPKRKGGKGGKRRKNKKPAKKRKGKGRRGGKGGRKGKKADKKTRKNKKEKRGKKKGGKGKGKKDRKGGKGGSAKGKGGKGKDKKNNNNNNEKDNENKKTGDKRSGNSLQESTQNKLWCFDLAMEQALEKCVEETLGKN